MGGCTKANTLQADQLQPLRKCITSAILRCRRNYQINVMNFKIQNQEMNFHSINFMEDLKRIFESLYQGKFSQFIETPKAPFIEKGLFLLLISYNDYSVSFTSSATILVAEQVENKIPDVLYILDYLHVIYKSSQQCPRCGEAARKCERKTGTRWVIRNFQKKKLARSA